MMISATAGLPTGRPGQRVAHAAVIVGLGVFPFTYELVYRPIAGRG